MTTDTDAARAPMRVWQYRATVQSPLRRLCSASAARVYGPELTVVTPASFFTLSGLAVPPWFHVWPLRQQSALVRAWLLHAHGGLYIDDSVLVFRRLAVAESALASFPLVGYSQHYAEARWRSDIMACRPGAGQADDIWAAVASRIGEPVGDPGALALDRQLITGVLGVLGGPALRLNGYYWRPLSDASGGRLMRAPGPGRLPALDRPDLEACALLDVLPVAVFDTDEAVLRESELPLSLLVRRALGEAR